VPHAVREELVRVAREFTQGNAVAVLPVHAELTAEAADLLSVCWPFLIG
jgi:predicted translin family RNA/ssDNA-binding protein